MKTRNESILSNDSEALKSLYNLKTRYGTWAYQHQEIKMKYLKEWAEKQCIKFINIEFDIVIRSVKEHGPGYRTNFLTSTEYTYVYSDETNIKNAFKIGTYHSLDLVPDGNYWLVNREWYTDPFADSFSSDKINVEDFKTVIKNSVPADFSKLNERRLKAVNYAEMYCGAASELKNGFRYNKKYRDYNYLGGDCANFASQILFEGAGFKKNYTWNYTHEGSKAWVNAAAFKDYMIYSGRASLISYGTYNKVFKASYKLLPGDFIAYEKKGTVKHISVVTGQDSKGYTLVTCHNTDRNRVPWDLGWSDKGIRFYLVRVHY